jgi:hypothetical protein
LNFSKQSFNFFEKLTQHNALYQTLFQRLKNAQTLLGQKARFKILKDFLKEGVFSQRLNSQSRVI